jgi:hypothetical protein
MARPVESAPPRRLRDFSIDEYKSVLCELVALGYTTVDLEALSPERALLFLRHDVDLCLERASVVAEAEHALGLKATYYVLVSTHMYNPASAQSRRLMARILSLGHEIGLHFDATQYSGGRDALEEAAEGECAILSTLTGKPVRSLSFHRPVPELMGLAEPFAGRAHTYEPRFFNEVGYISDSSGAWFRGHPLDHPAVKARSAIQLLTHPIWWHAPCPTSAEVALESLRGERERVIGKGLADATAKAKALSAEG